MSVEAAFELLSNNEHAVALDSKAGLDFPRQTRDCLHERPAPLGDIIIHWLRQIWVNEPKPQPVITPVVKRIHVWRTCNQGIEMIGKLEVLNRAKSESDPRFSRSCKPF